MSTDTIQPQPGRRPVYPVDSDDEAAAASKQSRPQPASGGKSPAADDPASDAHTESANHPNDDD